MALCVLSVSSVCVFRKQNLCVRSLGYIVGASQPLCENMCGRSLGYIVGASPPPLCVHSLDPCMLPTPLCGIFFTYICLTPLGILEKIFLVPLSHLTVLCLQVHLAGHVIVHVPELDGDLSLFTVLALLPGSPFPNLLSNCFLLFWHSLVFRYIISIITISSNSLVFFFLIILNDAEKQIT